MHSLDRLDGADRESDCSAVEVSVLGSDLCDFRPDNRHAVALVGVACVVVVMLFFSDEKLTGSSMVVTMGSS